MEELKPILKELAIALKVIAGDYAPNWQRPLKEYPVFPWEMIGAKVISKDQYGATQVSWFGHVYTRRSGENKKFGAAIWFSRAGGKEGEETVYLKLITFKSLPNPEPLPDYVVRALG